MAMGTVGKDFAPYAQWMDQHGMDRRFVTEIEGTYTAQAFITTDMDDNQITAFHPGAMNFAHYNRVNQAEGVSLGMVLPDGRQGMLEHARQFAEAGIPFVFDPGQGMPLFNGEELNEFIRQSTWVIVNDYEWQLLRERTGLSEKQVSEQVEALIITKGGEGSAIHADGRVYQIPAAKATALNDPTGCGDAYRAGLLYGLLNQFDWETTGRLSALLGAIKIAQHGTQNHHVTLDACKARFKENFGYEW